MVAEQQQRRLPGTVEKLKRARLIRRQKAGVLRSLGVPASAFEGRHEAPPIAAAAAPGKAPARQAHRPPQPPAGALPPARPAPIRAAMRASQHTRTRNVEGHSESDRSER